MEDISIHALVKRATVYKGLTVFTYSHFNPRPREEGDFFSIHTSIARGISIHALVKRATIAVRSIR